MPDPDPNPLALSTSRAVEKSEQVIGPNLALHHPGRALFMRCWQRRRSILLGAAAGALAGWLLAAEFPIHSSKFRVVREVSALDLGEQGARWSELLMPWGEQALGDWVEPNRSAPSEVDVLVVPATPGIELRITGRNPEEVERHARLLSEEATARANAALSNQVDRARTMLLARRSEVESGLDQSGTELVRLQRESGGFALDQDATAGLANLAAQEKELEDLRLEFSRVRSQLAAIVPAMIRQSPELVKAREKLAEARLTLTDENPRVKGLMEAVAEAERHHRQSAGAELSAPSLEGDGVGGKMFVSVVELRQRQDFLEKQIKALELRNLKTQEAIGGLQSRQVQFAQIKGRYQALQQEQRRLVEQEHSLGWVLATAVGAYRAVPPNPVAHRTHLGAGLGRGVWTGFGCLAGSLAALSIIMLGQRRGARIESLADLAAASGLPVLGELPETQGMSPGQKETWAATMLTRLRSLAGAAENEALLCGWASTRADDRRGSWIRLLVDAATRQGYRVIVVSPQAKVAPLPRKRAKRESRSATPEPKGGTFPVGETEASCVPVAAPMDLWKRAGGWSPGSRTAWSEAVQEWKASTNLVVFVEFPRSSVADLAVLSQGLPLGVWLCPRDVSSAGDIAMRSEIFKEKGGCQWVAGLSPGQSQVGRGSRLARWIGGLATLLGLCLVPGHAQDKAKTSETPTAVVSFEDTKPKGGFSQISPNDLAGWQKKLTLGPGDALSISIYENAETSRPGLVVGPDGRINYLEAKGVMAAGLTIDELRDYLEGVLSKYHRSPRVVIYPTSFLSKKYYILGSVVQKGIYPLDRPITVLEAIARARGFETSVVQRNALVTADLGKSFIVRQGADGTFHRLDIDLEGLFLRGDLSQNKPLAPEDYLYFPPLDLPEVYVLGEVLQQGVMQYTPGMTVLQAVVARGGFTTRAWSQKVLVVRGSLTQPKTIVLNVAEITTGKLHDLKLEPRDILYVSRKPWAKAQELLENAVTSFANAIVITWTGVNVKPIITEPIF